MLKIIIKIIPIILFMACSSVPMIKEQSNVNPSDLKLIYLTSKDIKFYDFGVVTTEPEVTMELFKLGKSIGKFTIKQNEVCFLDRCEMKWPASRAFFGDVSYNDLFEDILKRRDIFDGKGKRLEANNTIIQEFSFGGENFYYERSDDRTYFKNLSNGTLISIENYK